MPLQSFLTIAILQGRNLGKMPFPNPLEAPDDFAEHLKSLNLDFLLTAFSFCRTRPVKDPNVRYDGNSAVAWCERMDSLLVSAHPHPVTTIYTVLTRHLPFPG
jgi:hypothetical protein